MGHIGGGCDGHLECEPPAFEVQQCWIGLDPRIPSGQVDPIGCHIGCLPCDDSSGQTSMEGAHYAQNDGRRWLKRHPTGPNRDARGREHDIDSNFPLRVPISTNYLRAPCYNFFGQECFNFDTCDCSPPSNRCTIPFQGAGCPGTPEFCPCGGLWADSFLYTGHQWLDRGVECRHVNQHGPLPVDFKAGRLYQTAFVRLGGWGDQGKRACTPNVFVECTARLHPGGCVTCNTGAICASTVPSEFYAQDFPGGANPQLFSQMGIRWNDVRLRDNPLFVDRDKAVRDAKNKVLSYVATALFPQSAAGCNRGGEIGLCFDRLDSQAFASTNRDLDYWKRSWEHGGPCAIGLPFVPDVFGQCRTRFSGCPVSASLAITNVFVEMSLVVYRVCNNRTDGAGGRIGCFGPFARAARSQHPYVRIRVRVETTVRVATQEESVPGGTGGVPCAIHRPWLSDEDPRRKKTIRLANAGMVDHSGGTAGACGLYPEVVGGIDQIIYVDPEGRQFDPEALHLTEWWGELSSFSRPFTSNTDFGALGNNSCSQMAHGLTGREIPGWPSQTQSDSEDPAQIYEGSIELNMSHVFN